MKKMMTLTCSLCGKTYTEHAYRVGPLHECPDCRAKVHNRYMLFNLILREVSRLLRR